MGYKVKFPHRIIRIGLVKTVMKRIKVTNRLMSYNKTKYINNLITATQVYKAIMPMQPNSLHYFNSLNNNGKVNLCSSNINNKYSNNNFFKCKCRCKPIWMLWAVVIYSFKWILLNCNKWLIWILVYQFSSILEILQKEVLLKIPKTIIMLNHN